MLVTSTLILWSLLYISLALALLKKSEGHRDSQDAPVFEAATLFKRLYKDSIGRAADLHLGEHVAARNFVLRT